MIDIIFFYRNLDETSILFCIVRCFVSRRLFVSLRLQFIANFSTKHYPNLNQ